MVFRKIIFQNRYVELATPPPFMAKTIINFHFDYLNPSLIMIQADIDLGLERLEEEGWIMLSDGTIYVIN